VTTKEAVAAILTRLKAAQYPWAVEVIDGAPADTPAGPYVCIYDQTGVTRRTKYHGGVTGLYFPFQLSCVARTTDGLRDLVGVVRRAVLDWPPAAGATPVVEDGSNPVLSTGVGNDRRLTAPLTMHSYLPKVPKEN
jgi:hypothetical protein